MTDDVTSLWWENITGPLRLIEKIVSTLGDGKSVILHLDSTIAWQEQLRDFVCHRVHDAQVQQLPFGDITDRNDIAPRILRGFRQQYLAQCPTRYADQQNYLKNEHVLSGCVVWITGDGADMGQLVRFVSDYRGKSLSQDGAFLVEVPPAQPIPQLSDCVEVIRCGDFITHGDIKLFASILSNGEKEVPAALKPYAACVAANLAGLQAEMVPEIIHRIDFSTQEPDRALLTLWDEGYLPWACSLPSPEVLAQNVWKSQLQTAFAGIELERLRIVSENCTEIERALSTEYWNPLKFQTGYIAQKNDELESAFDVELGTIVYMMSVYQNADRTQRLLSLREEGLREWICFLKDCRNKLAHHKVCTPEEMTRLLGAL